MGLITCQTVIAEGNQIPPEDENPACGMTSFLLPTVCIRIILRQTIVKNFQVNFRVPTVTDRCN